MIESLYNMYLLNEKRVKVITPDREWDFDKLDDKLMTAMSSYNAEKETNKMAKNTQRGKRQKFREKKWVGANIPFGYKKKGVWISKDEKLERIITDIFITFKERKTYTEVAELTNKKYKDVFNESAHSK